MNPGYIKIMWEAGMFQLNMQSQDGLDYWPTQNQVTVFPNLPSTANTWVRSSTGWINRNIVRSRN